MNIFKIRKIPYGLAGASMLLIIIKKSCIGLLCMFSGLSWGIYLLNPWLFLTLLTPSLGSIDYFLSDFGKLWFSESFSDGLTPITNLKLFEFLGFANPFFFFFSAVLFWKLVFYIFSLAALNETEQKGEKKTLLVISSVLVSLLALSVATNGLHSYFIARGTVPVITEYQSAMRAINSGSGKADSCAAISVFGDDNASSRLREFCYFSLAVKSGKVELCGITRDVGLCGKLAQKQLGNKLDKTSCDDFDTYNKRICKMYLGILFQDQGLCGDMLDEAAKEYFCIPPFIFSE